MKIAVVGCGALGSYYGACLSRAGHETHFLLRSDWAVVRERGVQVRSSDGDFRVHPVAARTPEEIGPVDLVVIGLKTTANDVFPQLLPPLVTPRTAILTLQNGLGNEEALARWFPPSQILGGLCFVCLNRDEPGVIRHLAHGRIVLGELDRPAIARTHLIAEAFRAGGVPCDVTDTLARAHWEKLVWNIPFNGLGVASAAGWEAVERGEVPAGGELEICRTTDLLLQDVRWTTLVRGLMDEVIATANALGHAIPASYADLQITRTREMGAYRASTLVDFQRGQPLELESLFLLPEREARAAGVPVPRWEALNRVLTGLVRRHGPNPETVG